MKILLFIILTPMLCAAPLKVMVIGDSLSEEYRSEGFEFFFSAPASDPLNANTENWVELLAALRPGEISFGSYESSFGFYLDLRNAGYKYNWGVPSFEAETWEEVLDASIFDNLFYVNSRNNLVGQLPEVDAVVIFLGGNDANSVYRELAEDTPPENWTAKIVGHLDRLVSFIRITAPDLPIVIANIPDVGATIRTRERVPDPAQRAVATTYLQATNAAIADFAMAQNLTLFDVFTLTQNLIDPAPYRIGSIEFFPNRDPENRVRNLLCRDGFHPSTAAQAGLANLVVEALASALGQPLTPLSDVEILEHLGIDPMQDDDYLAWIASFNVSHQSFLADPDGDGLPNLGEYALGEHPLQASPVGFEFLPMAERASYVETVPTSSDDLSTWTNVPANELSTLPDGRIRVDPSQKFTRLEFMIVE